MSKQNFQHSISGESKSIYNKIAFPPIDKEKYPHGGYVKLRVLGWVNYQDKPWSIYEKEDYLGKIKMATFDDLEPVADVLGNGSTNPKYWTDNNGGSAYMLGSSFDGPYLIAGYKNGELRVSNPLFTEEDYLLCYANDLYALNCSGSADQYDLYDQYLGQDGFLEFKKNYVQEQAKLLARNGVLSCEDFLEIKIFNEFADKFEEDETHRHCCQYLYDLLPALEKEYKKELGIELIDLYTPETFKEIKSILRTAGFLDSSSLMESSDFLHFDTVYGYAKRPLAADDALWRLCDNLQSKIPEKEILVAILSTLYLRSLPSKALDSEIVSLIKSYGCQIDLDKLISKDDQYLLWANFDHVTETLFNSEWARMVSFVPTQPNQLIRFCEALVDFHVEDSICNPFSGIGNHLVAYDGIEGCEQSELAYLISKIRIKALKLNAEVKNQDVIDYLSNTDLHFDHMILPPPLEGTYKGSNQKVFAMALDLALKKSDNIVAVLPRSFERDSVYSELRKTLVSSHRLRKVVSIPKVSKPYYYNQLCIVVIDKNTTDNKVLFVDGVSFYENSISDRSDIFKYEELLDYMERVDSSVCKIVRCDELVEQKFDLSPSRYLLQLPKLKEGETYITLSKLVDIVPTINIKTQKLVSLTDFQRNFLSDTVKPHVKSGPGIIANAVEGQVLLANTIGKINVGRTDVGTTYLKKGIIPFRVKNDSINEDYLLLQLVSQYVQDQYESMSSGTFISRISTEDFLNLRIIVPCLEYQKQAVEDYLKKGINEAEGRYFRLLDTYKKDTHMKKHAIGQDLLNLVDFWDNLMKVKEKNDGVLAPNTRYGNMTVAEIEESIGNVIDIIRKQVDSFTVADDYPATNTIRLGSFLENFICRNKHPEFLYDKFIVDDDIYDVEICFSTEALTKVLKNIIFNARTHGFNNESGENNRVALSVSRENDSIVLFIANNGQPIHPDVITKLFEYGFSTNRGKFGHSGLGCYEAKSLMVASGGDLQVESNPEGEFTVIFKLIFNNTILQNVE